MPILSHLHQLFDVQTCYAYIHRLRWKERPLQCPRCQSQDGDPWGNYHYRPGVKRHWCNGCERTFNDLTNTYAALDPAGASRAKKGDCVRCLDHFDLLQTAIN